MSTKISKDQKKKLIIDFRNKDGLVGSFFAKAGLNTGDTLINGLNALFGFDENNEDRLTSKDGTILRDKISKSEHEDLEISLEGSNLYLHFNEKKDK